MYNYEKFPAKKITTLARLTTNCIRLRRKIKLTVAEKCAVWRGQHNPPINSEASAIWRQAVQIQIPFLSPLAAQL